MSVFEHYPNAIQMTERGNPDAGLLIETNTDGTVTVLAYSDGGDSWHSADISRERLLAALGVTA